MDAIAKIAVERDKHLTVSALLENVASNSSRNRYKKILKSYLREAMGMSKASIKDLFHENETIAKSQMITLSDNINELSGDRNIPTFVLDMIEKIEDEPLEVNLDAIEEDFDGFGEMALDSMFLDWSFSMTKPKKSREELEKMNLKVKKGVSHGKVGFWTYPTDGGGKIVVDADEYKPRTETKFFNSLDRKAKKGRRKFIKAMKRNLIEARTHSHSGSADDVRKKSMKLREKTFPRKKKGTKTKAKATSNKPQRRVLSGKV